MNQLSQKNDYIKLKAIAKNIAYRVPSDYGELEITINLSKPEKDPKEIAAAKLEKKKADAIIANDVSSSNIGFNADNHQVTILTKEGKQNPLPECSKDELALEIWKTLVAENLIR